jgi:hypothetical protein
MRVDSGETEEEKSEDRALRIEGIFLTAVAVLWMIIQLVRVYHRHK